MKKVVNVILILVMFLLLFLGFKELSKFWKLAEDINSIQNIAIKVPEGDGTGDTDVDRGDPFNRYIDFDALSKINKDIVAWIYIPGTPIDYPILVGSEDETYLNRDMYGNYNGLGSVFAFSGVDLSKNNHICLFAHNMVSGQMFGTLTKYSSVDYANAHKNMYIYTKDRTKECSLISVFGCKAYDEVFELTSVSAEDADSSELMKSISDRSVVSIDTSSIRENQIFTLSTCNGYTGTDNRFTTHFVVTKEKYIIP